MNVIRTLFFVIACSLTAHGQVAMFKLTPTPQSLELAQGVFELKKLLFTNEKDHFSPFREWLRAKTKVEQMDGKTTTEPGFRLVSYAISPDLGPEAYNLDVSPGGIEIKAGSPVGYLYAEQTLIQLAELNGKRFIPCMRVRDYPRFAWRGMHLDESRHFMGKAFVKNYIDWLFAMKMNVFHWHLTDAQGWRIEIKKYPKLTSVGAWRPDRTGILNSDADNAKPGEPMTYGGFYTQNDVREIVAYAAKRNITIIPEIEMPGHTTAALVAYPEYSCSGGPFPMPGGAKNCVYPNFCVGNENTYTFLEDILSEIIDLFPSQYIHIGGDEVERSQWEKCSRCQDKKKALGLTDEAQLQVYFTKRIEDFLIKKGRRLMGWDEIMEGGNLTPSAGVMVWRGENLAREATSAGHEVVINHNYYLDLYQGNPEFEPVSYGYLPLEKVYNYNPVPADFSPEQTRKVLGVEGCLWTENVYNTQNAAYMLFPRLFALAEVAWTREDRRDWTDFRRRIPGLMAGLDKNNIQYATSVFDPTIKITTDSVSKNLFCSLEQQIPLGDIHYTTDGTTPGPESPIYQGSFKLTRPGTILAYAELNNGRKSKTLSVPFKPSKASGKTFKLVSLPDARYNGNNPGALVDGLRGTTSFHDGHWVGFYGADIDLTIDLGKQQSLDSLNFSLQQAEGSWIYLPTECWVETSGDGKKWERACTLTNAEIVAKSATNIKPISVKLNGQSTRYIHLFAKNPGQHPVYPDGKCWLFVDEVSVE